MSAKKVSTLPSIFRDPNMSYEGQLALGGTLENAQSNKYMAGFRSNKYNLSNNMSDLIEGSNFDLSAMKLGQSGRSELAYKDIIAKNIGDIQTFRAGKMASGKEQIEQVHGDLKRRKGMQEELLNLHILQSHLPKNMQNAFLTLRQHGPLLGHLNTLNACFIPVLDYLLLYKSEIG